MKTACELRDARQNWRGAALLFGRVGRELPEAKF
jgi:hypothetical protein